MMYFSRVKLKSGLALDTLAQAIPNDMYGDHQAVWKLMKRAKTGESAARDFLFRREQAGHWPIFYILSPRMPEDENGAWDIEAREFQPMLAIGQRLAFAARVNPVVTRRLDEKKHGRDDIVMHARFAYPPHERPSPVLIAQQVGPTWLAERAEKHGFKVIGAHVDDYRRHRFSPSKGRNICFSTLDYQGTLEITDAAAFTDMLYHGLGRSKSFGCGLMLVRRV